MPPGYITHKPVLPQHIEEALAECENDGYTLEQLIKEQPGLTYDDFLMLPGHIYFSPPAVSTNTRITKNIRLRCPFVSSPMDTVSESAVAIAMALMGGIGIVHYNCSIEEQAAMVKSVKRFKNGFITNPLTLGLEAKVGDIRQIKTEKGFSGIPITDTGKIGGKLLGMVSGQALLVDFAAQIKNNNHSIAPPFFLRSLVANRICVLLCPLTQPGPQPPAHVCAHSPPHVLHIA